MLSAERAFNRLETYVPDSAQVFLEQHVLQDAILLQIFQIGENLSQLRSRFPEPYAKHAPEFWDEIIGFRNTIAHGYERVRIHEVGGYLVEDLEPLGSSLRVAITDSWFESSDEMP
ncbi:MAG: DUF86 domain-containing protein [Thermomicrobiales bacterium]|nr:DUF86 domain-containing protein [Thermomicrobiales bacterium]